MTRFLTHHLFQIALLLGVLLIAVILSFSDARWRQQMRNFTFDQYNILSPRESSDRIVIIDIDEASLSKVGQMPWPRTVMADLVDKLDAMDAAVIVFDIVFSEPDRISPKQISHLFENVESLKPFMQDFSSLPDTDAVFGESIKAAGNVVTGFSFTQEPTQESPRQKGIFRGKHAEQFVPTLKGVSTNLKDISKHAAGNGSFFVSSDTDGIIRRVPMLVAHDKVGTKITSIYPSLSLETIRVLDKERGGRIVMSDERYAKLDPARFGLKGIEIGKDKRFIPTNANGEFLVYFAPSQDNWYIPAHKVLDETLSAAEIKDKIVFIGTSAVGLKDIRSTPLTPFIPGVEVHLNIVDQILNGQFLTRSIEAEGLEAITILALGLFVILCAPFIGAILQAFVVVLSIGGLITAGLYSFIYHGLLIDITYPILSILIIFMLTSILTYLRVERERRAVRNAFSLYISPDFMTELTKDPDKLKLGGEIRELTVMFTDIRKFTSISEGLLPEELIQLMNDFLTPMSDLVMQNRGTIDKYMGDAMMAFWNAPLDDPEHARNACRAALGMQNALEPINARLQEKARETGKEPILLNTGIGINTGPCAVGNMGSKQRFAYSTLGDAVNQASRFEGQTKYYGLSNLIGEKTCDYVQDFAVLEIDLIRVVGKKEAIRIFTLIGDEKQAVQKSTSELLAHHAHMIELYRSRDFDGAFKQAQACHKMSGNTLSTLYEIYKKRCVDLMRAPPKPDWDGVFEATSK